MSTEPTLPSRDLPTPSRAAVASALDALCAAQSPSGSWHGDYGGPLFLLPMYVGTCYALGCLPDATTREGIVRYLAAHQNDDGGWGLDIESHSHVFTSTLNYVALRLLGCAADDPMLARARAWFLPLGGAAAAGSWGKFFLAVMGLYAWRGLEPMPPELWLLPESAPIHPSHLWCHARMVYLPMSWLYGRRATVRDDALLRAIRGELYAEPWATIDWDAARVRLAASDAYTPHPPVLRAAHAVMRAYEKRAVASVRERALATLLEHIQYEDRVTDYLCIGPVNKVLNALVWHFERPGGDEVRAHIARLPEYLYRADDGVKMQGYNSSELWDTTFAVQAMLAAGGARTHRDALARAAGFLEANQILDDPPTPERFFRHRSRGGWPFSTRAHGWPITDCTAEGLRAVIALDALGLADDVTTARRADAVELMLSWQNDDGGWATYEKTRGPRWLERLNPSDVFGDIMVDYSYVECTSACVQALRAYARTQPGSPLDASIGKAITRGEDFILRVQRDDGGWEGSWGVCFTYGTWFAVCALAASSDPRARAAMDRACDFLTEHQMADGGWGETVEACRQRRYVNAASGQAVMTSWALLALAKAGRGDTDSVRRGVAFLLARQRRDGRWPDEHLAGVFNKTCAIHYDAYLKVFPLWALAVCGPYATQRAAPSADAAQSVGDPRSD